MSNELSRIERAIAYGLWGRKVSTRHEIADLTHDLPVVSRGVFDAKLAFSNTFLHTDGTAIRIGKMLYDNNL